MSPEEKKLLTGIITETASLKDFLDVVPDRNFEDMFTFLKSQESLLRKYGVLTIWNVNELHIHTRDSTGSLKGIRYTIQGDYIHDGTKTIVTVYHNGTALK